MVRDEIGACPGVALDQGTVILSSRRWTLEVTNQVIMTKFNNSSYLCGIQRRTCKRALLQRAFQFPPFLIVLNIQRRSDSKTATMQKPNDITLNSTSNPCNFPDSSFFKRYTNAGVRRTLCSRLVEFYSPFTSSTTLPFARSAPMYRCM